MSREGPYLVRTRLRGRTRLLSVALVCCGVMVVAIGWMRWRYRLPAPTGTYAVGTRILDMTDTSRGETGPGSAPFAPAGKRALVVQLWYPAEASTNAVAPYQRRRETAASGFYKRLLATHARVDPPFVGSALPVLIYGHHWNGTRTENTALFEDLASHGYVVVSVDHPYNAERVLLADGRVIHGTEEMNGPRGEAATAEERMAFWNRRLDTWTADDRFVLDRLATMNADSASPLHGRLDTEHVGAFGHSFGGAVALRLCGLDPRVKAAVNLDGWTFGALVDRTVQPVLIVYEQASLDRRRQLLTAAVPGTVDDQIDRADNGAVESNLKRYGGEVQFVGGAQHMDFSDLPLLPPLHRGKVTGPIAPERAQTILRGTMLGFFDRELLGKKGPEVGFAEVTVERYGASAGSDVDEKSHTARAETQK